MVDYLTFGGIYREVALRVVDACYMADVFVHTADVLTDQPRVVVETTVRNTSGAACNLVLLAEVLDTNGARIAHVETPVAAPTGDSVTRQEIALQRGDVRLWTLDDPGAASRCAPACTMALRDCGHAPASARRFEPDGFYLNGARLPLIGLNRHQTYPCIGAAAPARQCATPRSSSGSWAATSRTRTTRSRATSSTAATRSAAAFEEIPVWQKIGIED